MERHEAKEWNRFKKNSFSSASRFFMLNDARKSKIKDLFVVDFSIIYDDGSSFVLLLVIMGIIRSFEIAMMEIFNLCKNNR